MVNIGLVLLLKTILKKEKEILTSTTGIAYTNALVDLVIKNNKDSAIVKAQQDKDYNILTKEPFDETSITNTKETVLGYLGAESVPVAVYIYSFTGKTVQSISLNFRFRPDMG